MPVAGIIELVRSPCRRDVGEIGGRHFLAKRYYKELTPGIGGTPSGSHYGFQDPRTVSLELRDYLKVRLISCRVASLS